MKGITKKNIKYIIHTADIHIRRTNERLEEYKQVFVNLQSDLNSLDINSDNSLIVICGDILHNEQTNNISEILCIDFFDNLNKLLPTIIIAGNHDYYVGTEYDNDSLQTILYKRKKELKNIYYYKI